MLTRRIMRPLARIASGQDHHKWLLTCENVELRGLEPLASCMPCTLSPSPHAAGRRPAWSSPAASVAGRGLASPGVAPRWLPTWLPELVSAANLRDPATPPCGADPHRRDSDSWPGRRPCGYRCGCRASQTRMRSTWIAAASGSARGPPASEVRMSSPSAARHFRSCTSPGVA
jgi:hypothetical protein